MYSEFYKLEEKKEEVIEFYFDKKITEFICPKCGEKLIFDDLGECIKSFNDDADLVTYDNLSATFCCEKCNVDVEILGKYSKTRREKW